MIVDIIIILLLIISLARGREVGFVRQACSTIGFLGGLFLGAWVVEPHLIGLAHTTLSRSLLTLLIMLGCAVILLGIGEYVGAYLKIKFQTHLHKVDKVDIFTGAIAAGLTLLVFVWLIAPVLSGLPVKGLKRSIDSSHIVALLDKSLPPAPNVIADLGHIINPNGFPQVFNGLEPTPPSDVKTPPLGQLKPAVNADRASVVKVEGRGCGGIVEGSGWVAGKGLIATNAHVVAGVKHPTVVDANGRHDVKVVLFDPDLDFAVLRVNNLAGKILPINQDIVQQGTPGAVLGYPGGGNFEAQPAAIMDEFTAEGRNIYGQGDTTRDVYEVRAKIIPGNSGGPLINKKAQVIGVVFAESTSYHHVGYALTMSQVAQEINQAENRHSAVSTGGCAE
jgi:S1-C subfamily serine protease